MLVVFHNVTISIQAPTPEAAYALLAEELDLATRRGILEYTTDTYTTPDTWDVPVSTEELWP